MLGIKQRSARTKPVVLKSNVASDLLVSRVQEVDRRLHSLSQQVHLWPAVCPASHSGGGGARAACSAAKARRTSRAGAPRKKLFSEPPAVMPSNQLHNKTRLSTRREAAMPAAGSSLTNRQCRWLTAARNTTSEKAPNDCYSTVGTYFLNHTMTRAWHGRGSNVVWLGSKCENGWAIVSSDQDIALVTSYAPWLWTILIISPHN